MTRYLDNGSTTFPKPACVADAVYEYMTVVGANAGRGRYGSAYSVEDRMFECRERLAQLFGASDCSHVVFSKNVTESLNVLLKGWLRPGDHVIVSSMEHNSVMRPLVQLESRGVSFSRAECDREGALVPGALERCLTPNTRAVVMTHVSNVCGTIMPIRQVGEFCQAHGLRFCLDSAQSAGVLPISMPEDHIDAVAFTGHKGLLGPQGIGGLVLGDSIAAEVEPLIAGGTGSASDMECMPRFLPDRLEAGTQNLPGIMGLHASLGWLQQTGIEAVHAHEVALAGQMLEELAPLEAAGRVRLAGKHGTEGRLATISIQTPGRDEAQVADALASDFGILTRVGLHCAPNAHKTLGTFPHGTIRFSLGYFNTPDDVHAAVDALREVLQ